jgi:UDP-N-acetylmuramoyl-L-alanyl-D-glutamate--2,6-diaminopimelate ligase
MNVPSIFPVTAHTDHVGADTTFVAIRGFSHDGVVHIPEALKRGAMTIVVAEDAALSSDTVRMMQEYHATLLPVQHTRLALAELAAHAAGYPSQKLNIIGITGTKGKTTTVFLLEHILRHAGVRVARITGVSNSINGIPLPANLTTPQPDYLHQFFKLCVQQGVTHVVMEVAAQALSLERVATLMFDGVIFTNIAREHFEFYQNMDDYFAAKFRIFNQTDSTSYCLVNGDDARCATIQEGVPSVITYGFGTASMVCATVQNALQGITIQCEQEQYICPSLIGHYNAENLLAVCLMARYYDVSVEVINTALATFRAVPGRMEKYLLPNGALAIIDYAHNPSSYKALLSTLRALTDHLIVLFGASGTRDKGKRPLMGAVAADYADLIILTADNPGPEDALKIIDDIAVGISEEQQHKIIKEQDRACAIQRAYAHSRTHSIIVLLGKGTDEYQVIKGVKHIFSEREIVRGL